MEEKLDMEYGPRKLKLPQDCVKREPFTVCRYHLDTNNHVNNGQYIRMAEEYLPEGFETGYLQVEYKKQAHLHDVIYPYVHQDAPVSYTHLIPSSLTLATYSLILFEPSSRLYSVWTCRCVKFKAAAS